jgi:uncharacterized protein YpbB
MPRSKVGLAEISGFGKIKIQQYGDEILDIIIEFCEANGIEVSTVERVRKPAKKALVKGSTQELSYQLFKEGKTIAEIAEIRQLTASTIEGHLGEYVKNGLLDVKLLMQEKKIKVIREFMLENPDLKGSALKEALGEDYSYGEIRLVGASMQVE